MSKYKVTVTEYQIYEVCVKAKNPAEAKEKALERYGYEGDVVYSGAEATDVEEETK